MILSVSSTQSCPRNVQKRGERDLINQGNVCSQIGHIPIPGSTVHFFDGSLQGYGACVYAHSGDQFNLISSSSKILGKSAFSVPQSEMAGALLASRMEQKIKQELFNVTLSPPTFIGDSEIILKMIAKNDPAGNLVSG